MQLLQMIRRMLRGGLQRFTESRRHRIEAFMYGLLQLGLGPGEKVAHRLDTGIEFDHALLTGSIMQRPALPQQYRDDDDDPERDHGANGQRKSRRIRQ